MATPSGARVAAAAATLSLGDEIVHSALIFRAGLCASYAFVAGDHVVCWTL